MKTLVVSCFYNEEFLVPHFLNHYQFADKILALVTPGTDKTESLLRAEPGVTVAYMDCPEGLDDIIKVRTINEIITSLHRVEWIIVPDADELVWPCDGLGVENITRERVSRFLDSVPATETVLRANMWQVFRHWKDLDLTTSEPPAPQRRHGDPERDGEGRENYRKPIILRANRNLSLNVGNHTLANPHLATESKLSFDGAHWAMADPCFCVQRRLRDRRDRVSPTNVQQGLGTHVMGITEEGLKELCRSRLYRPQVF